MSVRTYDQSHRSLSESGHWDRTIGERNNEVVEFYRRQTRLTATDVEWLSCEHRAVTAPPDSGGVDHVLDALAEQFNNGVPLGIVAAAMSKQDWTVGETLDALYELRMAGALWEPREDHLCLL